MLRQDTIPVFKPLGGSRKRKTNMITVQRVSDEVDKVDTLRHNQSTLEQSRRLAESS